MASLQPRSALSVEEIHLSDVGVWRRPRAEREGALGLDLPQGPGRGSNIREMRPAFNELFGSLIDLDDPPRHARLRRIVSRGLTPRMLVRVQHEVARAAAEIVAGVIDRGECDRAAGAWRGRSRETQRLIDSPRCPSSSRRCC